MGILSDIRALAFGGVSFNPATDIPSLDGKHILVTGGNGGLGKQAIIDLIPHGPAVIWLAARGPGRAQAAADSLTIPAGSPTRVKALEMDLASLDSVRAAAQTVLAESPRLDVLMANAGVMMTPEGVTAEGYELQFGTNHVGHFLLTKLLLPLLEKTAAAAPDADVRIVILSSIASRIRPAVGVDYATLKGTAPTLSTYSRYGQSKIANIWMGTELARRYPRILTVSVHPGSVASNLLTPLSESVNVVSRGALWGYNKLISVSVPKGAKTQLWAATAPREGIVNGEFYVPVGSAGAMDALSRDSAKAKELWEWSDKEVAKWL
ncbi:short-chain dehydrogenase/reductase [Schizothecium vesticola]|uniref:Short-chain dehydrogenase/reductase n=1 Tax=Schizothecium vesticola TaxID=314040 RepID=A0AA40EGP4_9PEZI|nr:short-chain dehydrogenase/reductase [Schizothecium vesticola]